LSNLRRPDHPATSPEGAALTLFQLVPHAEAVAWRRSDPGYERRKREFGDALIAKAERVIPDLRRHIVFREDASPATFARYLWSTDGAIYALALDEWHPPNRTPIQGLYLVGAGTTSRPGIEDVVISGRKVADMICRDLGIAVG